jgi:hypothetical protein
MFERLRQAVFVILGCAILLRVAWALLQPLLPTLAVLGGLAVVFSMMFRRHQ